MGQHIGILKERMKELSPLECLTEDYIEEVLRLPRKDVSYHMCDFDDTIFSREEQLSQSEILRTHRGNEGNKMIKYHIGIPRFIQDFYVKKEYPKDIISSFSPENGMFLTAGFSDIQSAKLTALGLEKYPKVVVNEGRDKILACIQYILFTLKYIPKELIIYEDRPQYFLDYRDIIEGVLGLKVRIMLVEMDGNRGYKKIEEI